MIKPYSGPKIVVPAEDHKNGHWRFPEQMGGAEYEGFIYVMLHKPTGARYLGKKTYRSRSGATSAWKSYTSSSEKVLKWIEQTSPSEWEFVCIEQYKTKGGLSYAETWSLCYVDAPAKDCWLNKRIEEISWKAKERRSVRHIERLKEFM
jgi:hypothetical protein